MKTNRLDTITDMLKERVGRVLGEARIQYGGVKPYRYQPPPEKERIYKYMMMTPEEREFGRQEFGAAYDAYDEQMKVLIQKHGVNTDMAGGNGYGREG